MTSLDTIAKLLNIDTHQHPDRILALVLTAIVELKDKAWRYDEVSK